jgi:hypothetical protein
MKVRSSKNIIKSGIKIKERIKKLLGKKKLNGNNLQNDKSNISSDQNDWEWHPDVYH